MMFVLCVGPIVGGKSTGNVTVPLAVHKDYFDKICPKPSIVHVDEVQRIAVRGKDYDPYKITQTYLEFINKLDDPCVEIASRPGRPTFIIQYAPSPRHPAPSLTASQRLRPHGGHARPLADPLHLAVHHPARLVAARAQIGRAHV